ncbi:MAG: sugar phosphate nucleotidyltransferase [Candidatus Saccharibacteria bacterium]|nr:sugar phosphate nucleotidyltransferase [Candidatus Saccharibacteria bacterium]
MKKLMNKVWLSIIAGGQGTRLFPLSNDSCPKQFCALNEKETFIQATAKRFINLGIDAEKIVVIVTNDNQYNLAKQQLLPLGILSVNIYRIPASCDYAGAMVKATEFIAAHADEDAIVINTPSDQYIAEGEEFTKTIYEASSSAAKGDMTIVGVRVTDLVTTMGCGHASYDPKEAGKIKTVTGFIEKPKQEEAEKLLRESNSACNTGINIWSVKTLMDATKEYRGSSKRLKTDELMECFNVIKLSIGKFSWYDCGTLKSLYDISKKTPNHKNASFGDKIDRTDCYGSLFITIDGVKIYAAGVEHTAVIVNEINGKIVVAVVKLDDSQKVRELAEDYKANKKFLTADFSVGARNNRVSRTNMSKDISVGFVGVNNYTVTVLKDKSSSNISVIVSNDIAE